MDGLYEVTAADLPVTVGGKTYRLSPLRARDWAEAARAINARRRGPLEIVRDRLADLSEPLQKHLLELAYREERTADFLPVEEIERWFASPEGRVYRLWLMLRRAHPEITLEGADELLAASSLEEADLLDRGAEANHGEPVGNSAGQAQPKTAPASSPFLGDDCFAN